MPSYLLVLLLVYFLLTHVDLTRARSLPTSLTCKKRAFSNNVRHL